jgi:hypothetical protein
MTQRTKTGVVAFGIVGTVSLAVVVAALSAGRRQDRPPDLEPPERTAARV